MRRQDDSISVTAARKYQAMKKIDLFLARRSLAQKFLGKKKGNWIFLWSLVKRRKGKREEEGAVALYVQ